MADETFAAVENLLRDQRAPLVEALRWSTVLLSEVEQDGSPESFDGDKVKIPVMLASHQGAGTGTETSTLNTAKQMAHDKVRIDTGIAHIAVGFTTKAAAAAKGGPNSWIDLVPDKMAMAEKAMRRHVNEQMTGAGNALIAAVTTASGGASTTVTVGTTANFHQLYAERIIDILVRSDGATVSLQRTITDFDEDAGTITIDVAVDTLTTHGIYQEGSYGQAIQGVLQAAATTGDFQTLSKTTTPAWRGIRFDHNQADPTMPILAKGHRRASSRAGEGPTHYLGDPAVIDKYQDGLAGQARWAGDTGKLKTGWTGVEFRNMVLVRDDDMATGTLLGYAPEDMRVYDRDGGADWDEIGGMFKRFNRSLPYEAWLVWQLQLGFKACNRIVEHYDLKRAS